ncbi:MAG: hypothetical protein K2G03_00655, partial [Bacilli bacterium]|nr:hypothetical protein [Bacilli bacterium]
MGLTGIREFYQQSDDKSIKLYQEYLAAVKKEISEGMVEAKKLFGDKDNVVIQIGEKICFIERIEKIIANSLKEIVSNSIINMSDSELLKIIGEHINGLKQEREESVKSLEALRKEKEQKSSDYVNKMNQLGYDVNFYKNVDVEDFFKEIKSASEYIMDLVRTDLDKDALRATFSWLYASTDVQEMLADMILSLRKIAKISDEGVVKKAISTFLTPEKFGRIVGIKEKNECLKSFELLQKELKMRTEFFERLPENLKDEITKQGIMEGETYHNLEELYREYLSTGGIFIPKNAGVSKIEIEIDEIKAVIDELDKKIEKAQSACESRKGMTTLVRSFIHFGEEDDYTYSEIKDETLEYRRMCQKINDRIAELTQREETLEEIENKLEMLTSMDEYTSCFDILEAKRELEIMESLTGDYKDEEIKSIALAERRRLR